MLHHKHYLGSLSPPTDNRIIDINVYYLLQITCNHNVEAMWTRSGCPPLSLRHDGWEFCNLKKVGLFFVNGVSNGFNFHSIKSIMARNLMIFDLLLSHISIWIAETWNCPGVQVSIGDQHVIHRIYDTFTEKIDHKNGTLVKQVFVVDSMCRYRERV